jgi:hypothetical protein|tara:strand:- start:2575 stop:4098 length:1524 start_codon:yes stop_codon:yes gene_type:complete
MLDRFKEIFDGLRSAYGITTKTGQLRERDGKHETKCSIIRQEPTKELYKQHLSGQGPLLGIIPINEQNLCRWGCVDIDEYNLDFQKIIDRTKNLPAQLFRSKSGGGHLFVFTKEWVPASLLRSKLKMLAAFVGKSGAEIIPKQDVKRSAKGVGSYLNLPYYGGSRTVQYAFNKNKEALTIEEFFEVYDKKALTLEELKNFTVEEKKAETKEDDFTGMPPCLKTLLRLKVGEGQRDNTMTHLAIYLKKRFPKSLNSKMFSYNSKYFEPPLEDVEVTKTFESVSKNDYLYTCKTEPMAQHCDPLKCVTEEFGVGDGDLPGILPESIEKYESDPPIYIVNINGDQVECDNETLWNPDKFGMACMDQTTIIMDVVSKPMWRKHLKKLFENLQYIPAPDSAKIKTQLKEHFMQFASRAKGDQLKLIKVGRVFIEDKKMYFQWHFFWRYLKNNGWDTRLYKNTNTQKMFNDSFGGVETYPTIDTKTARCIQLSEIELSIPTVQEKQKEDPPYK